VSIYTLHVLARGDKKLFLLIHELTKHSIRIRIHVRLPAEQQNQASKTKSKLQGLCLPYTGRCTRVRPHRLRQQQRYLNCVVRRDYSSLGRTGSTSTLLCAATTRHSAAHALRQPCRAPRLLVTRPHALYVNLVVHHEYSSPLSRLQRSTSTTLCIRVPQHVTRLVMRLVAQARRRLLCLRRASGCLGMSRGSLCGSPLTTSTTPRVRLLRHIARIVMQLIAPLVRRLLRLGQARRRLLRLRRASGCLGTSRGLSRDSSRRSSSTTPPRAGSSSTTSPPPRIRVPRHVARLVTWLVMLLVVDYSASRRSSSTTLPPPRVRVPRHVARLVTRLVAPFVVDYFASIARPGASARRTTCHAARRAARHRLLRLA
jgi:hypothetical protein